MKFILWKEILQVIDQDQDFLGVTDTCEYFEARTSDTRHLPALRALRSGEPDTYYYSLSEYSLHHISIHIRQSVPTSLVFVGKAFVIDTQQMQ